MDDGEENESSSNAGKGKKGEMDWRTERRERSVWWTLIGAKVKQSTKGTEGEEERVENLKKKDPTKIRRFGSEKEEERRERKGAKKKACSFA